ncbi:hypothetical protein DPMN_085679 [Dreissena polymorpha]|uniref:Uncharacterized protein n=1 Tax=Dreissena polymorpha TaxID=45954 RepID=A0A9D3YGK1_DREPO|nr:hypothetical protein DPMN_085679 [Dreissena polymorpha]
MMAIKPDVEAGEVLLTTMTMTRIGDKTSKRLNNKPEVTRRLMQLTNNQEIPANVASITDSV